eukprot:TRINITY_DN32662_c0_g1_i1.p3 TRINITY_DN32662_c0_g1~~TRINITY_DN32662_c0_g1_i1.p3  ORF type:complete len:102 (-),score=38.25 TRINITY_DN32662_c0_g1_i1:42-347(-)
MQTSFVIGILIFGTFAIWYPTHGKVMPEPAAASDGGDDGDDADDADDGDSTADGDDADDGDDDGDSTKDGDDTGDDDGGKAATRLLGAARVTEDLAVYDKM